MKALSYIALSLTLAACGRQSLKSSENHASTKGDDGVSITPGTMPELAECVPVTLETAPWSRIIFFTDYESKAQAVVEFKPEDVSAAENGTTFRNWLLPNLSFTYVDQHWTVAGQMSDTKISASFVPNLNAKQTVNIRIEADSAADVPYECLAM